MELDVPGADPVADHTWCCEHPEPWNYFDDEAEARLLSGLSRVFRVDPVETSWSLRIAEWTATDRAVPVLEEILAENAVTPKVRKRCQRLLSRVGPDNRSVSAERVFEESLSAEELLSYVRSAEGGMKRNCAADILGARLESLEDFSVQVAALAELTGMEHPAGDALLKSWTEEFPVCTPHEEAHLLLSASASCRPVAFDFLEARLSRSRRGFEVYDVYEAVRSLMWIQPMNATPERLSQLLDCLRAQAWWSASLPDDTSQMIVVEAALSNGASLGQSFWSHWARLFSRARLKGNYRQEAYGFLRNTRGLRVLRKGLSDPELFVRREAARSLRRQNSANSILILVEHVREQILTGHLPLDIEGADVVRYAMDGVLEVGTPQGADFLYEVFSEPSLATHNLRQRAALGLCFLGDSRCLEREGTSGLPAIVQAAICPLASESGDPLEGYLERTGSWLKEMCEWPLEVPEEPVSHLQRVILSKALVAHSRKIGEEA